MSEAPTNRNVVISQQELEYAYLWMRSNLEDTFGFRQCWEQEIWDMLAPFEDFNKRLNVGDTITFQIVE